jgi:hypothetical protein
MFSSVPSFSFRAEVQKYIRACDYLDYLLTAVSSPDCKPLSDDERRLVEYYREQLGKVIGIVMRR